MPRRTLTLLHASDLQAGTPYQPHAAEALVRLFERTRPDAVVVSGDLTQRAKPREFATAHRLLQHFAPTPVVVTPGNHDVPLYRLWERVFLPYRAWRGFSTSDPLDSVARIEGATFVSLNTSAPRRAIVNGRIRSGQLLFAERAFADAPTTDWRIVVAHHHFVPVPSGDGGSPLPNAAAAVRRFRDMGVDVVLGGHVHQLHLNSSRDVPGVGDEGRAFPILATGTATSRRGRGPEGGRNSVCLHHFTDATLQVVPYVREAEGVDFEAREPVEFTLEPGTRDLDAHSGAAV